MTINIINAPQQEEQPLDQNQDINKEENVPVPPVSNILEIEKGSEEVLQEGGEKENDKEKNSNSGDRKKITI